MANCHVLESHQNPTDRPSRRIKRSGGHSLVRQQLAVWIVKNVLLQMRFMRPEDKPAKLPITGRQEFIPEGQLPPKELPGIYFKFLRKLHNPEQISLT
jgi:hypothetical protein